MVDGPKGNRGKWSLPGVPHKGWSCIDIEDLGAPSLTCEMCESTEIRYAHYMQNPDFPNILTCGCICAGHMEEDLAGAKQRENKLKSTASRRRTFINSNKWYNNRNGNQQIDRDGFRITVFLKNGKFSGVINNGFFDKGVYTKTEYETISEVKAALFDMLPGLYERRKSIVASTSI